MRTEINATGYWKENSWYSTEGRWDINVSSILTQLIQSAGKYCKYYASDLFVDWTYIDKELSKGEDIDETYIFAIRDSGVDHKEWYYHKVNEPENYGQPNYHEVWELKVKGDVTEREIKMELKLIAN